MKARIVKTSLGGYAEVWSQACHAGRTTTSALAGFASSKRTGFQRRLLPALQIGFCELRFHDGNDPVQD